MSTPHYSTLMPFEIYLKTFFKNKKNKLFLYSTLYVNFIFLKIKKQNKYIKIKTKIFMFFFFLFYFHKYKYKIKRI